MFIDYQVDYIVQLIQPIIQRKVKSVEVTAAAYKDWNDWIDKRIAKSIFLDCHSYFRHNGTGKVDVIYPGSTLRLIWQTRSPQWNHFRVTGSSDWVRTQQRNLRVPAILGVIVALLAIGAASKSQTSWLWSFFGVQGRSDTYV